MKKISSKKTKPTKPTKTPKKKLPIKNSIFHKLLNSTMVLYLVFLVTCINIFNFIITKNDESLFLFILISVIIYEFNGNMIFFDLVSYRINSFQKRHYIHATIWTMNNL